MSKIASDKKWIYCHSCGTRVKKGYVYKWWPIRIRLAPRSYFSRWGVHIGSETHGRMVFQTIVSIGHLRIVFGPEPDKYKSYEYVREWQVWIDPETAQKRKARMEPFEKFVSGLEE